MQTCVSRKRPGGCTNDLSPNIIQKHTKLTYKAKYRHIFTQCPLKSAWKQLYYLQSAPGRILKKSCKTHAVCDVPTRPFDLARRWRRVSLQACQPHPEATQIPLGQKSDFWRSTQILWRRSERQRREAILGGSGGAGGPGGGIAQRFG